MNRIESYRVYPSNVVVFGGGIHADISLEDMSLATDPWTEEEAHENAREELREHGFIPDGHDHLVSVIAAKYKPVADNEAVCYTGRMHNLAETIREDYA